MSYPAVYIGHPDSYTDCAQAKRECGWDGPQHMFDWKDKAAREMAANIAQRDASSHFQTIHVRR